MTCIVGIEHEGVVYVGGDSAGVEVDTLQIVGRADEKVFINESGDFVMGFCGSFRLGQLLRYALVPPEQSAKKDDMAYLVVDFIDALRMMQKDKGAIWKENEQEKHFSQFLLGYRGRLYVVEEDFQVGRPLEGYAAIGCGADLALGALYASKNLAHDPMARVALALRAAAEHSAGVRAPFHVLKL